MANRLQLEVQVKEDQDAFVGSIQGVELLKDKVVKLTSTTVSLRKELGANRQALEELAKAAAAGNVPAAEAVRMNQQLSARQKELQTSLQQATFAQRTARQELTNLMFAQRDAQMEAQLLAAQFGVNLPHGIDRLVTRIPGVQRAISAAFVIAPVLALGAAFVALLPHIAGLIDKIRGIGPALEEQVASIHSLNIALAGPKTQGAASIRLTDLQRQQAGLEKKLGLAPGVAPDPFWTLDAQAIQGMSDATRKAREDLVKVKAEIVEIGKTFDDLTVKNKAAIESSVERARKLGQETGLIGLEGTGLIGAQQAQAIEELRRRQRQEGLPLGIVQQEAVAINEKFRKESLEARRKAAEKEQKEIAQLVKAAETQQKQGLAGLFGKPEQLRAGLGIEPAKGLAFDLDELHKRVKAHEEALADIQELEERAGIARLDPTRKAIAQINIEDRKRIAEFQRLRDQGILIEQELQDARVAIAMEAEAQRLEVMQKAAEEQRRAIEQYGNDLEGLFDRTIGSARSAKEAIANIWRELANEWKHQIFQQIAQATFPGARGPSATLGTSAGALGAILGLPGGLPGGIPGAGPGGTPPFFPETGMNFAPGTQALTGAGAISPAAVGAGTQPTLAASMGLPATTPIGELLGKKMTGVQQAELMGGLALMSLTVGNRNRTLSTLGGAFGGALTGLSIGGMIGGPIGAAIGAGIGFVAGGLMGFFTGGSGKVKRQDTAIENAGFAQIKQLLEDYERHRRDYGDTIDSMNRTWEQMAGQFVRSESKRDAKRNFELYISRIQGIEDERNRRRQLMALLPVPSFQAGGLVSGEWRMASGGKLAVVHPGEFVMSQRAVQRWGTSLLEGLNRGAPAPATSGGGYSLTVWTPSKEFAAKIVEEGIPVVIGRGGMASRMLRQ